VAVGAGWVQGGMLGVAEFLSGKGGIGAGGVVLRCIVSYGGQRLCTRSFESVAKFYQVGCWWQGW